MFGVNLKIYFFFLDFYLGLIVWINQMKLLFSEYLNQSRLKLSIKFPEQTLIIIIDMMFEKKN